MSDDRVQRWKAVKNENARKERELKKELGLCIELWCPRDAITGQLRCEKHQRASRRSVARVERKKSPVSQYEIKAIESLTTELKQTYQEWRAKGYSIREAIAITREEYEPEE